MRSSFIKQTTFLFPLLVSKMKLAFTLLFFAFVFEQVEGSTKCVTAVGIMRCKKNPSAHASVAVYLMDRDGIGPIFQFFDPNDLMA